MGDLELTKACADAVGVDVVNVNGRWAIPTDHPLQMQRHYDPLHDDAQAMALVKRFGLQIIRFHDPCEPETEPQGMCAVVADRSHFDHTPKFYYGHLNRAIVECVARLSGSGQGGGE